MEIERKWLFDLEKIPKELNGYNYCEYDQAYISVTPEVRIRRKRYVGGHNYTYVLCIKSKGTIERIEVQKSITEQEFYELMKVGNIIENDLIKKCHCIYDIDGYELTVGLSDIGKSTEFSYGEIEFNSVKEANEFKAPNWFGKEVTDDPSYKMVNYWQRTRLLPH